MPSKDKKRLEWFFRNACFFNAWAYTLVGSKPISTHQYTKPWVAFRKVLKYAIAVFPDYAWPPNFREICYFLNPEQLKIKVGWETLNKYMDYFPNSRFSLFTYRDHSEIVGLVLIDKMKLIRIVKQNLADFQEILQMEGITPEELSNNETLHLFLRSLNNDGLLGTLLGFGRDNARLYQKYRNMDLQKRPMVAMWPGENDAWLERMNEKNLSFQSWQVSDLFYPLFVCDPQSEETEQLKQTYREEREKIMKYYEGKGVVEATLSLFTSPLSY